MNVVTLRILGECTIVAGEARVTPSASHLFAVLLYLGVERGREVPKSTLFELLFPGESPAASAHNLRQLLYRVRKLGVAAHSSPSAVRLEASAVTDVVQQRLGRPYHESSKDPGANVTLLPAYQPPTAPFSKWVECYREGVNRALIRKLGDELHSARRGANWATVEAFASTLLTLDPFNETATLCLAESLARSGSKQRAVSLLQQFEEEVGSPASGLALPSRLLKRRISESAHYDGSDRAEAPLVGRTREMEMLADVWAKSRAGNCMTVAMTGEKSVGKSRLAAEFLTIVRMDGTGAVVFTRRRPADRGRPLSLFADICKQLVTMPGAAGCTPNRLTFLTRLTTAPDGFASLRAEQSEVQFSIGAVRRAIIDLIECVVDERPLIIAVDDARFLDHVSRGIVQQLHYELPRSRLMLFLINEGEPALSADVRRIRLHSLDATSLRTVAEHVLARHPSPVTDEFREWCIAMASGNPGYLELLLQSASTSCGRGIPQDLITLVKEHIGALSPHARHALNAIAIFGAACDGDLIERLCGLRRTQLIDALDELETESLTVTGRDGTACRSALIEECTRASISPATSTVLHARAARYLERHSRGKATAQAIAWRIAGHWEAAGKLERTRVWQRVCWRQSIAIGQPMLAASAIRDELANSVSIEDRGALLDDLAGALFAAMEISALQEVLHARTLLSSQLADTAAIRERLQYDILEARLLDLRDRARCRPQLRQFVSSGRLDLQRRIRAARILMIMAHREFDSELANETYAANSAIVPPDHASALLHSHTTLIYHSVFGDRCAAMEQIAYLSTQVSRSEPCWEATFTRLNVCLARMLVDANKIDLRGLEIAFSECREAQMNQLALTVVARIGSYLVNLGEMERAKEWLVNASPVIAELRGNQLTPEFISYRMDLALFSGDFVQAREDLNSLLSLSSPNQDSLRDSALMNRVRYEQLAFSTATCDRDIDSLLECHKRARSFGGHDDHMEVLWLALVSAGRHEQASTLLFEYVTRHRRERRPCNHFLRARSALDPTWQRVRLEPDGGYTPR